MPLIWFRRTYGIVGAVLLSVLAVAIVIGQEPQRPLGGSYSGLDQRRQQLVTDWVARFNKVTGQSLDAGPFYDDILSLSTKTTFDAVTHALITTPLTDASGQKFGDGLALIERVDTVRGEVSGASGDRQFRMYVRLIPNAREMLERSREFKRGVDNSIYHKGYPINYREQRGTPSIQVSIALDGRQADVDVDYRASMFPVGLVNGHLSSANSDVRAGNNADRHASQWSGYQQWWRSFFGVRLARTPDALDTTSTPSLPTIPRAGKKDIKVMVPDFLQAWLVEGDVVAAMGYVSPRSYACLARDTPDPASFDRGLAPFQILVNLKAAHDAIGTHRLARGPDGRPSSDNPWASRGAPRSSSPVRPLRRARQHRVQVRLRDPADPWRGEGIARVRPTLCGDLPHRRVSEERLDRVAMGQAGRVLEDRVLADGAGTR